MKIAAHRGNSLHAPENTRLSLLSAYTLGADVLWIEVRLTGDGRVVVAADDDTERLTGKPGIAVSSTALTDLRRLDFSATFRPRGSPGFHYRPPGRSPVQIESFPGLLDVLPGDVELVVEIRADSADRDSLMKQVLAAVSARSMQRRVVVCSADLDALRKAREESPLVRTALLDPGSGPGEMMQRLGEAGADGIVAPVPRVFDAGGNLTELGSRVEELFGQGRLTVGAILSSAGDPAVFTQEELAAAGGRAFVHSLSTQSMFDVAPFARPGRLWIDESFAGTEVNVQLFAFGYAKANRYCHVFQQDGVHVKIEPYDGPAEIEWSQDPLELRVQQLEEQMWYAAKTWPFYSGGGVGLTRGILGDFSAEVDVSSQVATQATMCEMAVVNADPGLHQPPWNRDGTPRLPLTPRNKCIFFDPHGAPPFVGSEHDEDDGYRINWNLGGDYDNNQYGKPVGDGSALAGRLRLERRGPWFSTYYRNQLDATDWVCTGVARNDSMNPTVHLRCAGKRWRQETDEDPTKFLPIVPNEFVFRNLQVTRFIQPDDERPEQTRSG